MQTRDKETSSAWEGDWEDRVYQRIKELGYKDYHDYLKARQGHSYEDLAAELSEHKDQAPIAPVQLERMHAWTVSPSERQDAMLDSFVRFLRGELRKGWGLGKYWETDTLAAMSFWFVNWGEGPELDAFRREILRMNPEPGWIPKDSDDAILQEAARRVWSTGSSCSWFSPLMRSERPGCRSRGNGQEAGQRYSRGSGRPEELRPDSIRAAPPLASRAWEESSIRARCANAA